MLVPATAFATGTPLRPVKNNPAERLVSLPIDPFQYDHASKCRKKPMPGTVDLQRWLERNARGISWGIMRCERWGKDSASLHAEGRALDWHLDVHNAADRREATRLINLLLAPDTIGNQAALARRMGIQEIIWNCESWWGGETMGPYSACFDKKGKPKKKVDETTAHMNHIHFGMNWRGAKEQTSFWAE